MSARSNVSATARGALRTGTRDVKVAPVTIIIVNQAPKPATRVRLSDPQWRMLDQARRYPKTPLEPFGSLLAVARRLVVLGVLRLDPRDRSGRSFWLTDFGAAQI